MADSFNVPKDVAKVFEIKDTSKPLYNFLVELANRLAQAEVTIKTLETRVVELESNQTVE